MISVILERERVGILAFLWFVNFTRKLEILLFPLCLNYSMKQPSRDNSSNRNDILHVSLW